MQPFCPQVAALETQLQKILLEAKQMEDAAMASLGEQMATEKGTHATAQATEPTVGAPASSMAAQAPFTSCHCR